MRILIFFLVLSLCACANKRKESDVKQVVAVIYPEKEIVKKELVVPVKGDSRMKVSTAPAEIKNKIISYEEYSEDTIIGKYHIHIDIRGNDDIIVKNYNPAEYQDEYWTDQSAYITIKQGDKLIWDKKELRQTTFDIVIPQSIMFEYMFYRIWIDSISNNQLFFNLNCCIPDTSFCYSIKLIVDENGKMTYSEIYYKDEEEYVEVE